jgi:hypothetical protein
MRGLSPARRDAGGKLADTLSRERDTIAVCHFEGMLSERRTTGIPTLATAKYHDVIIATLDRLLDDKLIYVHSSGVADTKASYLEGLQTGVWDYQQIDRTECRVTGENDVALVFCKLSIRIVIRGTFKAFDSRALAVWVRQSDGWRLLAVQSGAIAPAS